MLNKNFGNLDAVCYESNYDTLPPQIKKCHTYKNAKGTIVINYNTEKPEVRPSRRGANNIFHNRPGSRGAAKRVKTPLDAFALLVDDRMLEKVVEYTNKVIKPFLDQYELIISESHKYSFYNLVDLQDIRAFFGILFLLAAFRSNLKSANVIWNHESAHNIFGVTKALSRFAFIQQFITFNDKA